MVDRAKAETLVEQVMVEFDPDGEFDIFLMPDGPRGQWAAAVQRIDAHDEPDPETDMTVYVHQDGTTEGPY